MKSHRWMNNDLPSHDGKVAIVTGGNSGLGFDSAKALVAKGAKVIIACRSIERGEVAKEKILQALPRCIIRVMHIDLMNLESVKSFTDEFKSHYTD